MLDTDFNIIYLNQNANNISLNTYEISYVVGQNLLSLAPPYRKPRLSHALNEALAGHSIKFEVTFEKESGRIVFTSCSYSAVYDQQQNVVGICVLLKDITARKELEAANRIRIQIEEKHKESLQLFEQFMENSPLRAWITDGNGFIQYMNPLNREFLGLGDDYL